MRYVNMGMLLAIDFLKKFYYLIGTNIPQIVFGLVTYSIVS